MIFFFRAFWAIKTLLARWSCQVEHFVYTCMQLHLMCCPYTIIFVSPENSRRIWKCRGKCLIHFYGVFFWWCLLHLQAQLKVHSGAAWSTGLGVYRHRRWSAAPWPNLWHEWSGWSVLGQLGTYVLAHHSSSVIMEFISLRRAAAFIWLGIRNQAFYFRVVWAE